MIKSIFKLFSVITGSLVGVFIAFLFLDLIRECPADEFIDLKEMSIEYEHAIHDGRDPLVTPEPINEKLKFNIEAQLFGPLYWDSVVHSTTTPSQFRSIGWDYDFNLRVSQNINIYYHHHSQHLLDRDHTYMEGFPVHDGVGVKIFFFTEGERNDTLYKYIRK